MTIKNGKTKNASGRRETSQYKNEPERLGEYGQDSALKGNDQIGNAPTYSTGEDTARTNRQRNPNPGKILERLELIEKTFLSYVNGHQRRLETRLDESKSVENTFKQEVQALKQEIYDLTLDTNEEEPE